MTLKQRLAFKFALTVWILDPIFHEYFQPTEALKQCPKNNQKNLGQLQKTNCLHFQSRCLIPRKWNKKTWSQALCRVRERRLRSFYHVCQIFIAFKVFWKYFNTLICKSVLSHLLLILSSSSKPTVATIILSKETTPGSLTQELYLQENQQRSAT